MTYVELMFPFVQISSNNPELTERNVEIVDRRSGDAFLALPLENCGTPISAGCLRLTLTRHEGKVS